MPLTRDFKETVKARAETDAEFRRALFVEAIDLLISGDFETGKISLRLRQRDDWVQPARHTYK